MDFEYSAIKSQSNKEKHGIDFDETQSLWDDPDRVVIPAKDLDEPRYLLIGMYDNTMWSVIFTYRKHKIRIISARRARRNEKEIYQS